MPNDHEPGKPDGEFDGVTRLYIRTNPADDGSQPLAPGLAFWTSPDIAIVKPGGATGGEAVPLQVNQVRITVTNGGGIPAVDAYVEAFVANPATVITPATSVLIGGDYLTIQGYSAATLDLPWTPTAADAGHRCIVARVSLIAPPDTYLNPAVFDVVGDRHVAQRNIAVLAVPAGKPMSFRFAMQASSPARGGVQLRAVERTQEVDAQALAQLAGCAGGLPSQRPLASLGVRMLSPREARGRPTLDGDVAVAIGLARRPDIGRIEPEVGARLDPQAGPRLASVTFQVEDGEERGRLHLVDVVQVDPDTGEPQGGLTFVLRVE